MQPDQRGRSSVGRAPALQAGGRRFDPVRLHQFSGGQDGPIRRPFDLQPFRTLEQEFSSTYCGLMDRVCAGVVRRETVRPIAAALCYCKYDVVRIAVQPATLGGLRIVPAVYVRNPKTVNKCGNIMCWACPCT